MVKGGFELPCILNPVPGMGQSRLKAALIYAQQKQFIPHLRVVEEQQCSSHDPSMCCKPKAVIGQQRNSLPVRPYPDNPLSHRLLPRGLFCQIYSPFMLVELAYHKRQTQAYRLYPLFLSRHRRHTSLQCFRCILSSTVVCAMLFSLFREDLAS